MKLTVDLLDNEIYGHVSRSVKEIGPKQVQDAIYMCIRKEVALSTDALCTHVAKFLRLANETEWINESFKRWIYRNVREMEKRGSLASGKVYNGKGYERIWKRS